MSEPQSFAKHARLLPAFHFFVVPVLFVYLGYTLWVAAQVRALPAYLAALVAMALVVLAFVARIMALTVQNRVIRLEERLRLARLLPADLQGRVEELTVEQLVGLRFAADGEVAELTRKVLEQGIADRKTIKSLVTSWRPDHLRA